MSEELRAALAEELEFRFGGLVSGETEDWQRAAREIVRSGPVQDALAALSQPRQEDGLPQPDDPESIALGQAMNGAMAGAIPPAEQQPSHYRAHVRVRLRERGYDVAALSQPRQEDGLNVARLRKLSDAATPGRWYVDGPEFGGVWVCVGRGSEQQSGAVHPRADGQPYAVLAGLGEADADFIVAAVNAVRRRLAAEGSDERR